MVFRALDQLQSDPLQGFVTLVSFCLALAAAITVHEFSHALAATLQGDSTARNQGRLTLSPLAHLDPVGSFMILFAGFGWGRPTPINPVFLRAGQRTGMAVVALAGPISNVLAAMLVAIPINFGLVEAAYVWSPEFLGEAGDIFGYVLVSVIFWNLLLAAFNLIPVAPLDGFKVALGVLPREAASQFARLERVGPAILFAVILLDIFVLRLGILAGVIRPTIDILARLVFW